MNEFIQRFNYNLFYCKRFWYIYIEITEQVEIYKNIYMNKAKWNMDLAINELPLDSCQPIRSKEYNYLIQRDKHRILQMN